MEEGSGKGARCVGPNGAACGGRPNIALLGRNSRTLPSLSDTDSCQTSFSMSDASNKNAVGRFRASGKSGTLSGIR